MARIHYWELSNYNNGKHIGKWFDLDSVSYSDHVNEIKEWMEELTEKTGELCEEWIVGDSEEIPARYVGEYGLDPDYFDYIEALETSGLDAEIFESGADLGIDLDRIADAYLGEFNSPVDYAMEYVESTGLLDASNLLRQYFDYESFARDLMIGDIQENNGHYFSQNW